MRWFEAPLPLSSLAGAHGGGVLSSGRTLYVVGKKNTVSPSAAYAAATSTGSSLVPGTLDSTLGSLARTCPWAIVVLWAMQGGWSPEQVNYLIISLLPIIALQTVWRR